MKSFLRAPFLKLILLGSILAGCVLQPANVPTAIPTPLRVITDTPAPTAFIMPTPPAAPTASCAGAPRERLIIGERGRVLPDDPRSVNVRRLPGTKNTLVTTIPINALFTVLDGPVCAEGFEWYKVHYREATGWLAEGDLTSYYVEPYGTD
ncbi:MAG: SH3 domain-containing protein [Anaerolineae bacterium]|nr:SH3 domain-containing protein [Anaerolineae bacterium]